MLRALFVFAVVAGAFTLGCKEDAKPPVASEGQGPSVAIGGGGGGSSSALDGSSGASPEAGVCSGLTVSTAAVDQNGVNDTVPNGTGGSIANGIYDLQTDDVYIGLSGLGGPTGVRTASTISINGNAFERVESRTDTGGTTTDVTNASGTLAVSGVNAVLGITCPLPLSTSLAYSVSSDGAAVTFYDTSAKEARTYRLR